VRKSLKPESSTMPELLASRRVEKIRRETTLGDKLGRDVGLEFGSFLSQKLDKMVPVSQLINKIGSLI